MNPGYLIASLGLEKLPQSDLHALRTPFPRCRVAVSALTTAVLQYAFPQLPLAPSLPVLRPHGSRTHFTTAGIQVLETVSSASAAVRHIMTQPCIRMQFAPQVSEGTSSSFVLFNVVATKSSEAEFVLLVSQMLSLFHRCGLALDRMRFRVSKGATEWTTKNASREALIFSRTALEVFYGSVQLGEAIYAHDYPINESERVRVSDVGFSIERLNWVMSPAAPYMVGFEETYASQALGNADATCRIIDCIRSAVLIAGEGVRPSGRVEAGVRLREYMRLLWERAKDLRICFSSLGECSARYWSAWGWRPSVGIGEIINVLQSEYERHMKVHLLGVVRRQLGIGLGGNVDCPWDLFLKHAEQSLPGWARPKLRKIVATDKILRKAHLIGP
jgi:hypothetical protein